MGFDKNFDLTAGVYFNYYNASSVLSSMIQCHTRKHGLVELFVGFHGQQQQHIEVWGEGRDELGCCESDGGGGCGGDDTRGEGGRGVWTGRGRCACVKWGAGEG